jgi:hypothetical protein
LPRQPVTHCKWNHDYTPENTRTHGADIVNREGEAASIVTHRWTKPELPHGRGRYDKGCRCYVCRSAQEMTEPARPRRRAVPQNDDRLMGVEDLAEYLGIPEATVYKPPVDDSR